MERRQGEDQGPGELAERIGRGHARRTHYPDLSEEELAGKVQHVIDDFDRTYPPGEGAPSSGRKIWIKGETVVIKDPANPDGGTVFEPDDLRGFVRTFIGDNP